jgi:hypothetical protein
MKTTQLTHRSVTVTVAATNATIMRVLEYLNTRPAAHPSLSLVVIENDCLSVSDK